MKKIYLDMTKNKGALSVFIKDAEVFEAGTTIYSMQAEDNNDEYKAIANVCDIHFIFDDKDVNVDFYTVPRVDIFAKDSSGGYLGTVGGMTGMDCNLPICYIDQNKKAYLVANSLKSFLDNCEDWKEQLKPFEKIEFFSSIEEAEKKYEFVNIDSFKK